MFGNEGEGLLHACISSKFLFHFVSEIFISKFAYVRKSWICISNVGLGKIAFDSPYFSCFLLFCSIILLFSGNQCVH